MYIGNALGVISQMNHYKGKTLHSANLEISSAANAIACICISLAVDDETEKVLRMDHQIDCKCQCQICHTRTFPLLGIAHSSSYTFFPRIDLNFITKSIILIHSTNFIEMTQTRKLELNRRSNFICCALYTRHSTEVVPFTFCFLLSFGTPFFKPIRTDKIRNTVL